jgi:hypothetical protein
MKRTIFLLLTITLASCSGVRKTSSSGGEDDLVITRKYVGDFIEYRHTGPENYDGPNIIWIKTSMEDTYGKISAYGKNCDFIPGDRLYLRKKFYSPGIIAGYWVYMIENESAVSYRATDLQHDREVLIKTWFE